MRRLRSLSEAESARLSVTPGVTAAGKTRSASSRSSRELALEGEALRVRFEEFLDARDPLELAEPEAA